ncbi:MAG TPA: hypothetical protein VHK89_01365, partial [Actinomycetota bacterium]|nr:hypothetical protein [Actinomycetota bacterium]
MKGAARRVLCALALVSVGVPLLCAPALAAQDRDLDIPVMIQTVPELPGAVFELDGRRFNTDEHGLALITVGRRGVYRLRAPGGADVDDGRAEFARWSDDSFSPTRSIAVDSFTYLEAGYDVVRPLEARVVSSEGAVLEGVRSFTLVDDLGVERSHAVGQPIEVRVSRATVGPKGGLRSEPVFYELGQVVLEDGAIAPPPGGVIQPPDAGGWDIELVDSDPIPGDETAGGGVSLPSVLLVVVALAIAAAGAALVARMRTRRPVSAPGDPQESLTVAKPSPEGVARGGNVSIFGSLRRKAAPTREPRLEPQEPEPATADALTAKLQALAEEIDGAAGELARVRAEKTDVEAQMRAATERLHEQLRARDERAAESARVLDGLRRDNEALRARAEAAEAEARGAGERAAAELAALAAERDDLAEGLAASLREVEGLRIELEEARTAAEELRTERDRLGAIVGEVSGERDRLWSEAESAGAERDEARAGLAAVSRERDETRAQLAALAEERDRIEAARATLARDLGSARAGLEEARAESAALRGERAALNEKLRNALGQLVAMEEIRTARTRARAEADALRREREALS